MCALHPECDPSKISRIENGVRGIHSRDLTELFALYKVSRTRGRCSGDGFVGPAAATLTLMSWTGYRGRTSLRTPHEALAELKGQRFAHVRNVSANIRRGGRFPVRPPWPHPARPIAGGKQDEGNDDERPARSVFTLALPDAPRPAAKDYIQFAVTDSASRWSREFTARFLAPVPPRQPERRCCWCQSWWPTPCRPLRTWARFHGRAELAAVPRSPDHQGNRQLTGRSRADPQARLADHGRGLHVVDALTNGQWGWFRWPSSGRKVVWRGW